MVQPWVQGDGLNAHGRCVEVPCKLHALRTCVHSAAEKPLSSAHLAAHTLLLESGASPPQGSPLGVPKSVKCLRCDAPLVPTVSLSHSVDGPEGESLPLGSGSLKV